MTFASNTFLDLSVPWLTLQLVHEGTCNLGREQSSFFSAWLFQEAWYRFTSMAFPQIHIFIHKPFKKDFYGKDPLHLWTVSVCFLSKKVFSK